MAGIALALLTWGLLAVPAWGHGNTDTTRSTSIALNEDGLLLFNVNAGADSVTVFSVEGGGAKSRSMKTQGIGLPAVLPSIVARTRVVFTVLRETAVSSSSAAFISTNPSIRG